jgi:protein gp37
VSKSAIEWTEQTWNPIVGCSIVSPGCTNCYAMKMAARIEAMGNQPRYAGTTRKMNGNAIWTGKLAQAPESALTAPLRRKKPTIYFVNSMSDLFHEDCPDEWIDRIFAVMALCPQHTFQVLTKRAGRMRDYVADPSTPARVAMAADIIDVAQAIAKMGPEEIRPIAAFPGYFISDRGRVFSSSGSARCMFCGEPVNGAAHKMYCSKKCRQNACFYRRTGRPIEMERALTEMDVDGGAPFWHLRVILYRDGEQFRDSVHRLVLTTFDRPPIDGEQGCHRNGNPLNNALPNLRWGTQSANWQDRKRHGRHRAYSKLAQQQVDEIRHRHDAGESGESLAREFDISATQIRNIASGRQWAVPQPIGWPLENCWKGVSCERQQEADERIPLLLQTPAAIRFISAEPLLGPIDLRWIAEPDDDADGVIDALSGYNWIDGNGFGEPYKPSRPGHQDRKMTRLIVRDRPSKLDWVIVGGESGPNARPMHPDWPRELRDQCLEAAVPFFFKQFGEYKPISDIPVGQIPNHTFIIKYGDGSESVCRVGKKAAGRSLDGVEYNEMPEIRS